MRAATAETQWGGECLLRAVPAQGETSSDPTCCNRSNGGTEPQPVNLFLSLRALAAQLFLHLRKFTCCDAAATLAIRASPSIGRAGNYTNTDQNCLSRLSTERPLLQFYSECLYVTFLSCIRLGSFQNFVMFLALFCLDRCFSCCFKF